MDGHEPDDPKKRNATAHEWMMNEPGRSNNQGAVDSRAPLGAFAILMTLFVSWPGVARGEDVRLAWDAPPGCPERSRFEAEVRARTSAARFTDASDQVRRFEVDIARSGDRWVGALQIEGPDSASSRREFDGDACDEVVSALALLTALAIDPNASSAPADDLVLAPAEPQPLASAAPIPPPPVPARPVEPPSRRPATLPSTPWHMAVGPEALLATRVGPQSMPALGLFAEVWQPRDRGLIHGYRVALSAAWSSSDEARWQWYQARVRACPLRTGWGSVVAVRGCAGIDAGVVHGEGVSVAEPRTATRPWLGAGTEAGLVIGDGPYFAGVGAGLVVPLTRYRYRFDRPTIELHETPPFGLTVGLEAGLRIF